MLRYMLVVLLYAITYCTASDNKTDIPANGLQDSAQISLPNTNEDLTPAQQTYNYQPNQQTLQLSSNLIQIAGSGYLITPGMGAHKLHPRILSWNKARKICIQEGGHLAVINSISEEKILLQILAENKMTQAWLGIHDLYENGDWNTIMDESLETTGYSKWRLNQPGATVHCGALVNASGMDALNCTTQNGFFCEIDLSKFS